MDAKNYFQQVREAEQEIRTLKHRRDHYEDMATSCSAMGGDVRRTKGMHSSKVEHLGLSLADLDRDLAMQERVYVRLVRQAQAIIAKLDKPRYRRVLTLRYLTGLGWQQIADDMGYSEMSSAFKVHGWALKAVQPLIPTDDLEEDGT